MGEGGDEDAVDEVEHESPLGGKSLNWGCSSLVPGALWSTECTYKSPWLRFCERAKFLPRNTSSCRAMLNGSEFVLFTGFLIIGSERYSWPGERTNRQSKKEIFYKHTCIYTHFCCRSDSLGSIRNLAGISIFWIGRFHTQPISESHIGRLYRKISISVMPKRSFGRNTSI